MFVILVTISVAIFLLLLLLLIIIVKQQKPAPRRVRPTRQSPPPQSNRYPELINLLYGDKGAAQRLVNDCSAKNPGRSYDWVLNKVIRDLERDR